MKNIMGEYGWKEVLKQFLEEDRAKTLAAAWDGDRYAVFEQKQTKKLCLGDQAALGWRRTRGAVLRPIFGSAGEEIRGALEFAPRPNFFSFDTPDGGVFLDCLGNEWCDHGGCRPQNFDAFTKELSWPLAPQPPEHVGAVPEKTAAIFSPGARDAAGTFCSSPRSGGNKKVARVGALAPQRGDCQFGELNGFNQVFGVGS